MGAAIRFRVPAIGPCGNRRTMPITRTLALTCIALATVACGAGAPDAIRREMERSPQRTTTVVVFTDFQCPYCRRTHDKLTQALAEKGTRARVVLRHVPLRSHPDAATAARAAVCAEALLPEAASSAFYDAMYHATDLSEAASERLAVERGADRERFRACTSAKATTERLAEDRAAYKSVGGDGVPLVYVDKVRIDGEPTPEELDAAFEHSRGSE